MDALIWPDEQPTLRGNGITLRPWRSDDAGAVEAACQDADIQRWTMVPAPYTAGHARGFVDTIAVESWQSRSGAAFAVVDDDDRPLASCGLVRVELEHAVCEAGYWVAADARRARVGARALETISRWALDDVGFARVELHIDVDNEASCRTAEAVGFDREGVLRSRVFMKGQRRDLVMYAMTR